jgi:hypothetical protein
VLVFSLLVRAFNAYGGLGKYDYLALNESLLHGFTIVDNCCSRGVIALAVTTLIKGL